MRNRLAVVLVVGLLGLGLVGCQTSSSTAPQAAKAGGCAVCAAGKAGQAVWCDHCGKGFVGGKPTKCKGCVTAASGGPACQACARKG